ncbi:hypothetical protein SLEP1_g19206 [Rubroshorea leprosula]|nr:hypothetical protein SLEP1_g19206 [Rubroshorea leprosula]
MCRDKVSEEKCPFLCLRHGIPNLTGGMLRETCPRVAGRIALPGQIRKDSRLEVRFTSDTDLMQNESTSGAEQGARAQAGAGARLGRAGDPGSGRRAQGAGRGLVREKKQI